MGHIINLGAQQILQSLKAESLTPEVQLAEQEFGDARELSPAWVLVMSRKIPLKVCASNLLLEALSRQTFALELQNLKPLLDMRIWYMNIDITIHRVSLLIVSRWNSTYVMIQRMLYLQPALDRLISFETK